MAIIKDGQLLNKADISEKPVTGKVLIREIKYLLDKEKVDIRKIDKIGVMAGAKQHYSSIRTGVTAGNVLAMELGCELVKINTFELKDQVKEIEGLETVDAVMIEY